MAMIKTHRRNDPRTGKPVLVPAHERSTPAAGTTPQPAAAQDASTAYFTADDPMGDSWTHSHAADGFDPSPEDVAAYQRQGLNGDDAAEWAATCRRPTTGLHFNGPSPLRAQDVGGWQRMLGHEHGDLRHGVAHPADEARRWSAAGFNTPQNAGSWHNEGFTPSEAAEWESNGFTEADASHWKPLMPADDANYWRENGWSDPQDAANWNGLDVSPPDARMWLDNGVTGDQASDWMQVALGPEDAGHYQQQGTSPQDARATEDAYQNSCGGCGEPTDDGSAHGQNVCA